MGANAKQKDDKSWVCVSNGDEGPMTGIFISMQKDERPLVQWGHGDNEIKYAWHSNTDSASHRFDFDGPNGELAFNVGALDKKPDDNGVNGKLYDFSTEPREDGLWTGEKFFCAAVHRSK